MAEHPFEDEAARLFAVAPDPGDTPAFVAGVEQRLARFVRIRGYAVGFAGALGAALAVRALAGSPLVADIVAWSQNLGARTVTLSETATAQATTQTWLWLTLALCAIGLAAAGAARRI